MISLEEGFKKGYLQNKKVYLKPVPRGGKLVKDKNHVAYFQYEGASNWMQLSLDEHGGYVNPFTTGTNGSENIEEREFFEDVLGLGHNGLNVHIKTNDKQTNFWDKFIVKVTKDWELMNTGKPFNLANPKENLQYRVLKEHHFVAPSWEDRFKRGEYRFALVEEGYEVEKESSATELLTKAWTYFGSIQNSKQKMSDFLGIYLLETKSTKEVPSDANIDFLKKEIKKIIESDINNVVRISEDEKSAIKLFILKGLKSNAITKEGRNSYSIPGEGVKYMYNELIDYISKEKDIKGDTYLKIEAIIKNNK